VTCLYIKEKRYKVPSTIVRCALVDWILAKMTDLGESPTALHFLGLRRERLGPRPPPGLRRPQE
jgi:hypothetical protein